MLWMLDDKYLKNEASLNVLSQYYLFGHIDTLNVFASQNGDKMLRKLFTYLSK